MAAVLIIMTSIGVLIGHASGRSLPNISRLAQTVRGLATSSLVHPAQSPSPPASPTVPTFTPASPTAQAQAARNIQAQARRESDKREGERRDQERREQERRDSERRDSEKRDSEKREADKVREREKERERADKEKADKEKRQTEKGNARVASQTASPQIPTDLRVGVEDRDRPRFNPPYKKPQAS